MAAIVERQSRGQRAFYVKWRDRAGKQHWTRVDGRSVTLERDERSYGRNAARRLAAAIETCVAVHGTYPEPTRDAEAGDISFGEFVPEWLERVRAAKQKRTQRTADLYAMQMRVHLLPRFETTPLTAIRRRHVLDLRDELRNQGAAKNTTRNILTALRACLNDAVDRELIESNPAARIEAEGETKEVVPPTPAELARILEHCRPDAAEAVLVTAALGLRRGEVFGLTWADISFDEKVAVVVRQNHRARVTETTKTAAGRRVVPLYRRPRVILAKRRRRLDPRLTTPDMFVFGNLSGGPIEPGNFVRREWKTACKRAGLDFPFHALRHYGATALDEQGLNGKLRAELLGHADERISLDVYTHVRRERVSRAAGEFDPLRGVRKP